MAKHLNIHQNDQSTPRTQRARAYPVVSPFHEIERLFDELIPTSMLGFGSSPLMRSLAERRARMPRVDLVNRDEDLLLRAEVPGLNKDDLDISIDEASVTLRGSTSRDQHHEEQEHYYRREISHDEFLRVVALPVAVDTAKAKATLEDGVLELVMPKLEAAKRRRIPIK